MTHSAAVLDLHGTVYRGDRLVPGAETGLEALAAAGLERLFFSNNPTRTPAAFADELAGMGVDATADEVLTAGVVTASYLRAHHADDAIYVVGEAGLLEQLAEFHLTEDPRRAEVLLASIDRQFSYDRLTEALRALESGATFLGTDPDRTIPAGPEPMPGSGAIVGAIAATVGRDPKTTLGKPAVPAARAALDRLEAHPSECLVVGDRLDTDVALGERIGATTVLVETGIHDREDVADADVEPDFVLESLAGIDRVLLETS